MKRKLSLLLVLALMVSLISSCASPAQSSSSTDTSSSGTSTATDTAKADSPATSNATTTSEATATPDTPEPEAAFDPNSGEKPVLKFLIGNVNTDPNLEPPLKMIEERTGYKLEVSLLPAENSMEKLLLDLANQVEYDFIRVDNAQFYSLITTNALMPLDELIAQYGQTNINKSIRKEDWARTQLNGVTLGIPRYDAYFLNGSLSYNTKMAEDLGINLDKDVSLDEFHTILKTVKEKNPSIIPLSGAPDGNMLAEIASAFGISYRFDVYKDNGTLKSSLYHPNMVAFLEYMNSLYSEGLLDIELPVNSQDMVQTKFTSGAAFMAWTSWSAGSYLETTLTDVTGGTIGYIHPLKDSNGNMIGSGNKGTTGAIIIPRYISSERAAHVMNYLDLYCEPENFEYIFIGVPGVHHDVTEVDGIKQYTPIFPACDEWANGHFFNAVADPDLFTSYWQARVAKNPINHEAFKKINSLDKKYWVNDPINDYPPLPTYSKNKQVLSQFVQDNIILFITGDKPLSEYESFVSEWLSLGGQDVVDEISSLK